MCRSWRRGGGGFDMASELSGRKAGQNGRNPDRSGERVPERRPRSHPQSDYALASLAHGWTGPARGDDVLAAIDLGTNNCRLLIARPEGPHFRVIDAFSRIVRLGEGVSHRGSLSTDAVERTLAALRICETKMRRRRVTRFRAVVTEACRRATNGSWFLDRVRSEIGLSLEVITSEEEAGLALAGCGPLLDPEIPSLSGFRYRRRLDRIGVGAAWARRSTYGGCHVSRFRGRDPGRALWR